MHLPSSRTPAALLAAVVAVCLSFTAPLVARADAADTAGVGVARISLIHGTVAVQRGDSTTAVDAVINAPVLGSDYVTTGNDARAEVQFDGSSAVRLGENVQLRFTHLDTGNRELQLAQGTVELRLLRGTDGRSGIDTPSISIRPRESGSYRVTVDGSGQTAVTVRSGAADIETPQGDRRITAGTTLFASGAAASPSITSGDAIAYDDFDRFNQERDAREQRAIADAAYVDNSIEGVDDLQEYGHWVNDGSYGNVWVPYHVASSWAPYRQGRWVWEDYYGWTWVADEPWGWAPYHYGNWYHSPAYGWCWYPPHAGYYAPVWRPALVAFISFGSGWSLGFGDGGIGWVPLAPFETYRPWWGSHYYNNSVTNITNVTNVTNNNYYGNAAGGTIAGGTLARTFQNAQYNGVTAIGNKRFLEGRFDHPVAVAPAQLKGVTVVRGAVPVVPTQANLRFRGGAVVATPVVARPLLLERTFAGNTTVVPRRTFEQQRSAIAGVTHLPATPANPPIVTTPAKTTVTAPLTTTVAAPVKINGASPWDRFATHTATPVDHPVPVIDAPTKPRHTLGTAHPADATAAHGASDPWARFGANHATTTPRGPASAGTAHVTHGVTVIDGGVPRTVRTTDGDTTRAPAHAHGATVERTVTHHGADVTRPADGANVAPHPTTHVAEPARDHATTTTTTTTRRTEAEHPRVVTRPPG